MTITKEACTIFNDVLKKYNKYAIVFKYVESSKQIAMRLVDENEGLNATSVDGVMFIFENGADKVCKGWTIVEQNGKLTIKKESKCCCDGTCEYVCNKVTCKCDKED